MGIVVVVVVVVACEEEYNQSHNGDTGAKGKFSSNARQIRIIMLVRFVHRQGQCQGKRPSSLFVERNWVTGGTPTTSFGAAPRDKWVDSVWLVG